MGDILVADKIEVEIFPCTHNYGLLLLDFGNASPGPHHILHRGVHRHVTYEKLRMYFSSTRMSLLVIFCERAHPDNNLDIIGIVLHDHRLLLLRLWDL